MDKQHQKSNEGRLRTLAAKGIGKALRFVAGPGKLHDAAAWNSVDFVPISAEYEFAVSDVVSRGASHMGSLKINL